MPTDCHRHDGPSTAAAGRPYRWHTLDSLTTFPATVDAVDARWIADALGAAVTDVDVVPISERLARVHVRYSEDDAGPATVVVKLPATGATDDTEHEARFYRDAGPLAGIRVPWCFRAQLRGDGAAALVLEDLADARRTTTATTTRDAGPVVDALADFHASWWDSPYLDTLTWMPATTGASPVHTIVHGDFRPDHLFFDLPDGDAVAVIDWQLARKAPNGLTDVVTFLAGSPGTVRDASSLLARYQRRLAERGVTLPAGDWQRADRLLHS